MEVNQRRSAKLQSKRSNPNALINLASYSWNELEEMGLLSSDISPEVRTVVEARIAEWRSTLDRIQAANATG